MNKLGLMLFIGVITLSSLNSLFLYNSKNDKGDFDFDSTSIPLNTEFLKLCISGYMIYRAYKENDPSVTSYKWSLMESLKYMVPAVIYAINNNIILFSYLYLNPVHVVPLNNFKMIWTCILWRVFFKRKISNIRLAALAILIVGCLITQQEPCPELSEQAENIQETVEESTASENPDEGIREGEAKHKATGSKKKIGQDDDDPDDDDDNHTSYSSSKRKSKLSKKDPNTDIAHPGDGKMDALSPSQSLSSVPSIAPVRQLLTKTKSAKKQMAKKSKTEQNNNRSNPPKETRWIGVALVILETFLSALAGVYTEALMKKGKSDSIHVQNFQLYAYGCIITFVFYQIQSGSNLTSRGYFEGYNIWAILFLVNTAFGGLMISGLLKYVDNIAKIFSQSISIGVVTILGIFFFNYKLNIFILMGLSNIGSAVWLYYVAAERILPDHIPTPDKSKAEDDNQVTTASNGTIVPKQPANVEEGGIPNSPNMKKDRK